MTAPPACPDPGASQGQWNAYAAAGADRAERARRLALAPERLRAGIEAHVQTLFAVRRYHQRRITEKAKP